MLIGAMFAGWQHRLTKCVTVCTCDIICCGEAMKLRNWA